MADDNQADVSFMADTAFFAALTTFLDDYDIPSTSGEMLHMPVIARDDDLLLSNHQLLSDADALVRNPVTQPPVTTKAREKDPPRPANLDNTSQEANKSMTRREIKIAQASIRRDRYRQKLKDERMTLIQQESELSSKLRQLQSAQAQRRKTSADTMIFSAWRTIAKRQMEKRLEVAQQQQQLRAAVVSRARFIHQMKAFIQEPKMESQSEKLVELSRQNDGGVLIKCFLRELKLLYSQIDQLFSELKFKMSMPLSYNPRLKKDQNFEYFESTDAAVIPCGFERTADAISSIMLSDWGGRQFDEGIPDPENTTAMRHDIKYCCGSDSSATLVCYTVTRRYKEAGRLVFIWRILTEGQEEFSGLHTVETGWLVVRPSTNATRDPMDSNDCSLTVIENCTRLVPMSFGGESKNQARADRFTKIVIKSSKEEIKEMTRVLSSILLESP